MHQSTTLLLLLTMAVLQLTVTCPLPTETCPSLPQDSVSYAEYLQHLGTLNDYSLHTNISHTDGAFYPHTVSSVVKNTGSLRNINAGCSGRDFNFSKVRDGDTGTTIPLTCPLTFLCDYNPQRVPAHIFHARCISSSLSDGSECREVFYPVVTMTTESCDPLNDNATWKLTTEQVAVSCAHVAAQ